ncbi:hypothetical protein FOA52_005990 [Chlamydomonas sp. UWO 241]|nr:hypothetical protein FOA52_005990 [Chlamydomonas sp. UWO 241]
MCTHGGRARLIFPVLFVDASRTPPPPARAQINNNRPTPSTPVAVEWLSPQWQTSFEGVTFPLDVFAPALTLATPTWRFTLKNDLPFQRSCACGLAANQTDPPRKNNILGIYNGFHNLMYTNIYTHGLKVDVGVDNLTAFDPCEPVVGDLCAAPNMFDTSDVKCDIFSDNVYATVVSGGSVATNTYILPTQCPGVHWYHHHQHGSVAYLTPTSSGVLVVPDMHPCQLFAPKTLTGHYTDYNGIRDWRDWNDGHDDADVYTKKNAWRQTMLWDNKVKGEWDDMMEWNRDDMSKCVKFDGCEPEDANVCSTFQSVIGRLPNFSPKSDILTFTGLYFRIFNSTDNSTGGTQADPPSDDTLPFLACNALPPDPLICPRGDYDAGNVQNVANNVGLDWVALNGAIQPTLTLTAKKYSRWQMVNTMTMKWLDLTIAPLPTPNGDGTDTVDTTAPTDCKMWLLSHDGVYLEHIPRLPQTSTDGGLTIFNDIILGTGNRADVLVKCNTTGRYGLYSGAGPLSTVPECLATHCELFGSEINENGARVTPLVAGATGNSYFDGAEIFPALLAVIEVEECGGESAVFRRELLQGSKKDSSKDKKDDKKKDDKKKDDKKKKKEDNKKKQPPSPPPPSPPAPSPPPPRQCIPDPELSDEMCRTRLELFSYTDYPNWGFDAPPGQPNGAGATQEQCVNMFNLDAGAACNVNGQLFAWNETRLRAGLELQRLCIPPDPPARDAVRFNIKPVCIEGAPNNLVSNFWEAGDFWDTVFIPTCTNEKDITTLSADLVGNCTDRYRVAHCHVLAHEDEGCMVVVWWKCPTTGNLTCPFETQCVYSDTPGLI